MGLQLCSLFSVVSNELNGGTEEAPENSKESSHSAHGNGMNEVKN
jgi:hypothetical protein